MNKPTGTTSNTKFLIGLAIAGALGIVIYLGLGAFATKAEATDIYSNYPQVAAIEAAAQTVKAPKLNGLADVVKDAPALPTEAASDQASDTAAVGTVEDSPCHVTVPEGTTVSRLEAIQAAMADAGCSVKSWFSSIELPFSSDDVAEAK